MSRLFETLRMSIPKPVKRFVRSQFFDAGGIDKTVFLAGSHRSGTTWAAAMLNFDNRYRDMYEPFNGERVAQTALFTYGLYLRPDDPAPPYAAAAESVLAGRIRNETVDRRNKRFFATSRIVKETHANLWIAWLHRRFPSVRIVLLVRHPFAVAHSRRVKSWPTRLDPFLEQQALLDDHIAPFRDLIGGARGEFEQHVANWCVQHYVPFRQLRRGDAHVLFYEHLCCEPARTLQEVCEYLGRPYSTTALEMLAKPSFTARDESPIRSGTARLVDEWRDSVSSAEVDAGMRLLRAFSLDTVYGEGPMPLTPDPLRPL